MTNEDFAAWAAKRGFAYEMIEQVIAFAATPEEMKAACDAIEPPPPIYALQDIKEMTDGVPYGISPSRHGFMIVGGCPNGDPIALDIAQDVGSVWYLGHETMHDTPLRSVAIRVADDLDQFIDGVCNEDDFPIDYYQAKQKKNAT